MQTAFGVEALNCLHERHSRHLFEVVLLHALPLKFPCYRLTQRQIFLHQPRHHRMVAASGILPEKVVRFRACHCFFSGAVALCSSSVMHCTQSPQRVISTSLARVCKTARVISVSSSQGHFFSP